MSAPWLALYVFYGGDQDGAIVNSIAPGLRRLRASGWIARYFFIRYWNGGPHLRIRAECLRPVADVEREIRKEVERFLRDAPRDVIDVARHTAESARIHSIEQHLAAKQTGPVEPLEPIQPSGTIQTRPYRFDEERYGGPWAVEDTHDHAWASTEIACSVLESTTNNPALRRVFALHAAAIVPGVLEADDFTALEYFTRCSDWEVGIDHTPSESRWENGGFLPYARQRTALNDVRALMDRRESVAPKFWSLLLETWRRELVRRREFLVHAYRTHRMQVHPDILMLDAMHLFMNRLGMGLTVECYLYYLVAGTLQDRIANLRQEAGGTLS
jgi:Lantibiotic biosynthesis dehydratase C-term